MTSSCKDAVELLPWLVNGSLDEAQRRALLGHLEGCESCRRELDESAQCWEILTRHIPSLALAEYAEGLVPSELAPERIERHLELCPACRRELEWMTADRVLDFAEARAARRPVPQRSRLGGRYGRRRIVALAAGIAAAIGLTASLRHLTEISFSSPYNKPVAASSQDEAASVPNRTGNEPEAHALALFADGLEKGSTDSWSQVYRGEGPRLRTGVDL